MSTVSNGPHRRHLLTCHRWTEDVGDARRRPLSSCSDEDFIKALSGWKGRQLSALFLSLWLLWRAVMERASLRAPGEFRVGMPASPATAEGRFNLPLSLLWPPPCRGGRITPATSWAFHNALPFIRHVRHTVFLPCVHQTTKNTKQKWVYRLVGSCCRHSLV